MLRYRVPKGGKNVPLTNIDAIAIDDLSLTIERKKWKESWCKGTDINYYLGLEWMRTGVCNTSVEIKGQPIKGGPRWFEAPGEFVKTGIQGVKQAANAVFKFVTQDMWTGLVNGLISAGWYALYGGLIILGIFFDLSNYKMLMYCNGYENLCKTKSGSKRIGRVRTVGKLTHEKAEVFEDTTK